MPSDLPTILFYLITAIAIVLWLCGLQYMIRCSSRKGSTFMAEGDAPATPVPANVIGGSAEVIGAPADLAAKAAGLLARQGLGMPGSVKILEQGPDRLIFEGMPGMPVERHLLERAELHFHKAGSNKTRIDYAIQVPSRPWLLTIGWVFVALGLIAIVTGFTLIQFFVLDRAFGPERWQALQMLQTVHFLWPQFLFGGLYWQSRTQVAAFMDAFVHNLPFCQE